MENNNSEDKSIHFIPALVVVAGIVALIIITKNFFDTKLVINGGEAVEEQFVIPHVHMSDGTIYGSDKLISEVEKIVIAKVEIAESKSNDMSGKELFSDLGCDGCHGVAGKSVNPMFPVLAGKESGYIVAQLKAFQDGTRVNGMMTPMAIKAEGSELKIDDYLSQQK